MVVAVDLDGVIFDFDWDSWVKHGMDYFGKLKEGAIGGLMALRQRGYKIVIHTCRINPEINKGYTVDELRKIVSKALKKHGIPFDEIWVKEGKPIADYYIDDRAIRFESWSQVMWFFDFMYANGLEDQK